MTAPDFFRRPALPLYAGQGGLQPGITNILSQSALLDAADAGTPDPSA